jgi:hypothetical protein
VTWLQKLKERHRKLQLLKTEIQSGRLLLTQYTVTLKLQFVLLLHLITTN